MLGLNPKASILIATLAGSLGLSLECGGALNCFTPNPAADCPPTHATIALNPLPGPNQWTVPQVVLSGSVAGFDSRAPYIAISVQKVQPPPNNALLPAPNDISPPAQYCATLDASGNFSELIPLGLGKLNVILTVSDLCGNVIGSRSVQFIDLPQPIRDRFTQETGGAAENAFLWGVTTPSGQVAVFNQSSTGAGYMAIADVFSGQASSTVKVEGDICFKWMQWVSEPYHEAPMDFCPLSEFNGPFQVAGTVPSATGSYQDFVAGRIYESVGNGFIPGLPNKQLLFVPRAFADALDTLEGVETPDFPDFPLSDPLECPGTHTWIFQQFQREYDSAPITMEIKGEPPTLWVERRGGDLRQIPSCVLFGPNTPGIFQSFPCACAAGGCVISPPPAQPPTVLSDPTVPGTLCKGEYLYKILDEFNAVENCGADLGCVNTHIQNIIQVLENLPTEWIGIKGDATQTAVTGFLGGSFLAGDDLGFSHRTYASVNGSLGPIIYDVKSDWNFEVYPFQPYTNVLTLGQLNNPMCMHSNMEIEIEAFDLGLMGPTQRNRTGKSGDIMFASGRWIIDCGHPDWSSEIHPPGIIAISENQNGPYGLETVATLLASGYYTGDPATVEIYPPPRPAPNAILMLTRTNLASAEVGVTAEFDPDLSSYMRVHFQAPLEAPLPIPTTIILPFPFHTLKVNFGELFPDFVRSYYGEWTLGWQPRPFVAVFNYAY
jgi:hypothetical protein